MTIEPDIPNAGNLEAWYANQKQPDDVNATVWRYMDFAKFVSLLESQSLFFCRLDLLGDSFEGTVTKPHYDAFCSLPIEPQDRSSKEYLDQLNRTYVFASCWHLSDYENAALWKIYGLHNKSVAVKTAYSKLRSIPCAKVGLIEYIDHNAAGLDVPVAEAFDMRKRHCFSHEREVRALVWKQNVNHVMIEGEPYAEFVPNTIPGIPINVNLQDFLGGIVIHPEAEEWFIDLIAKLLKRYGLDIPVSKSELAAEPYYGGLGFPIKNEPKS